MDLHPDLNVSFLVFYFFNKAGRPRQPNPPCKSKPLNRQHTKNVVHRQHDSLVSCNKVFHINRSLRETETYFLPKYPLPPL